MATRRNLYLYLTLACFLGIILIFIFDGYVGVYDSLETTSGEYPYEIQPDQWPEDERDVYYSGFNVGEGGKVSCVYEVDNRRFSAYETDIEITVWQNQEQVAVLLAEPLEVASFAKERVEWVVDTAEFIPDDISTDERYDFTLKIKRGDVERNVLIYVRGDLYVPKPVVAEPVR